MLADPTGAAGRDPLQPEAPKKEELPRCGWCGDKSKTRCGRCKARAYCSVECQKKDWKSGHSTSCFVAPKIEPKKEVEPPFKFWHVRYVVHWAINVGAWELQSGGREWDYLLSKISGEAREAVLQKKTWREMKWYLARHMVVNRMTDILTQQKWWRVTWKHDPVTNRDYLVNRNKYLWTGKKYIVADSQYPNFSFSVAEAGNYLFIASHPGALTGLAAAAPGAALTPAWEAVAAGAQADGALADPPAAGAAVEAAESASGPISSECNQDDAERARKSWNEYVKDVVVVPVDGDRFIRPADEEAEKKDVIAPTPQDTEVAPALVAAEPEAAAKAAAEGAEAAPGEDGLVLASKLCSEREWEDIREPEDPELRNQRLRHALAGKEAYFRAIGRVGGACDWPSVHLNVKPSRSAVAGGVEEEEAAAVLEGRAAPGGNRRHPLHVGGVLQNRWRVGVHDFQGHVLVVCRAPPEEAHDPDGEFRETQKVRHPELEYWEYFLDMQEPAFIDVPIQELLPEAWRTDYERACGRGERGDALRINR